MKIKHEETLLFYDCELLFQAKDPQGQTYIVSHTGDGHKECEYMAVPVDQKTLSEFKAGRIDLRDLMLAGSPKEWYSAKATGDPDELELKLQRTSLAESPKLPMKGFHPDPKFSHYAKA